MPNSAAGAPAAPVSDSRPGWPALLTLVGLLGALQLATRPLLPVDETRYLSVAWEMWVRGDFLVPYLNGQPYSHKPPLLFWMIQALWGLFGVSPWPARLLPVGLSLGALWGTARLARRLWPHSALTAQMAPWLLFGGLFWMNFYTLVQFDLLLVLAALAAWAGVLQAAAGAGRGWLWVALGIGMGVLAKGPVILLPVLPALLLAPWWRRAAPARGWPRWYLGAAAALSLGAALALSWALPAGLSGGEAYRQAIFWGQSAGRVVASFAHRGPWWEYLLWFPLLLLPWVLWPPLWRGLRHLVPADDGVRFCLAVLLPALLVFSLISGKQAKYLLPLLPLAVLLLARALASVAAGKWSLWPAALLLLLLGGALSGLAWWPAAAAPAWVQGLHRGWGVALMLGAVPFLWLRLRPLAAVRALTLAGVLSSATLYLALVPPLAPQYRLQTLATQLGELQRQGHTLGWVGRYHGQFQFLGRLRAPLSAVPADGVRQWLHEHPQGYLLVRDARARPQVPADLVVQPYRSGSLVLWPAQRLLRSPRWLDALAGNA